MFARLLHTPLVCLVLSVSLTTAYAQDVWLGGGGAWSNAAQWSLGIVPDDPTIDVEIDNGNPIQSFVVFDLPSGSVGNLTLDSGDRLLIQYGGLPNSGLTSYLTTSISGALVVDTNASFYSSSVLINNGQIQNNPGGTLVANVVDNYGGIDNSGFFLADINNYNTFVNESFLGYIAIDNAIGGFVYNYGGLHSAGPINNAGFFHNDPDAYLAVFNQDPIDNTGTFDNLGAIYVNAGSLNNVGTINNISVMGFNPALIDIGNGGLLNNSGTIINNAGGSLQNAGTINNNAGGSLPNYGTINNAGTININSSSAIGNYGGSINNTGTVIIASGAILASTAYQGIAASYTQSAGSTVVDGLFISDAPIEIDGGTLSGSGVIQGDVMMAGTMSPGDSPGTLTLTGNYTQISQGTFYAEIAGLAPGTQYDQLLVGGTAALDGTLDVVLLNGFVVRVGDSFVLMMFGSENGQFSTLDLPSLPGNERWLLSYNANDLTLSVAGTSVPEPSSFPLLGTGLLVGAGILRRKLM